MAYNYSRTYKFISRFEVVDVCVYVFALLTGERYNHCPVFFQIRELSWFEVCLLLYCGLDPIDDRRKLWLSCFNLQFPFFVGASLKLWWDGCASMQLQKLFQRHAISLPTPSRWSPHRPFLLGNPVCDYVGRSPLSIRRPHTFSSPQIKMIPKTTTAEPDRTRFVRPQVLIASLHALPTP